MANWFGPRRYLGIGSAPRSWEAWLAAVLVLAILATSYFVNPVQLGFPAWSRPAVVIAACFIYVVLSIVKYDSD
jgi:hypothetical protein